MISVLLHIPHAATEIPAPWDKTFLLSRTDMDAENLRLADLHTDDLYHLENAERAVFPISRFLVDPERFRDDADEPMAARGMGALYTVTTDLKPLRPPPCAEERETLLTTYYDPHHDRLNRWADTVLSRQETGLLVDCHSYPSSALPYELETVPRPRPEICIGTDPFHTPLSLQERIVTAFRNRGYEVGLNTPFAGTLVPGKHYGKSPSIMAFMIEVRRDLYMNEKTGRKTRRFDVIRHDITSCLRDVTAR